ncbi:MAG TPA: YdeI/OmpD-associated family protein [Acidimicrobiales bacterium]
MKFTATLELNGKTATGVEVPEVVLTGLGQGKRPPVVVTIGGHTFRSSIGSMGGRVMLPVSAQVRTAAGVVAGEAVDIEIELDTAPREVVVPEDLAAALARAPKARAAFQALSYSKQRQYVLPIEGAKAAETRARRIAKAIDDLTGSSG